MYNQFIERILMPVGDFIIGSSVMRQLNKWRQIQNYSSEKLAQLQRQNLQKLLSHVSSIPYYRDFDTHSEGDDPYACLQQFPILQKDDIKQRFDDFFTLDKNKLISEKSSGSSGVQMEVLVDRTELSISQAIQILWWEWAGYQLGYPLVQTGMTPNRGIVKKVKDILLLTNYIMAFEHSEDQILQLLKTLERKKQAPFLAGYASSLYAIACIAEQHNLQVNFKSAISWGDKLFDHYRKKIDTIFQTKVFETYGCGEGIMIGAQADLPYMYIMSPHVVLEIVDDNGTPLPDGELGHVVVTRLDHFSMPLIRYKLGDLAIKLPKNEYPTHRKFQFPLLKKVIGRDTDIVKTPSNKIMIVHFFTGIFEHIPQIKQFRVIQNELDAIRIEYIPGPAFYEGILDQIRDQIQQFLKEPYPVHFKKVDHIPPTPSGKPQIVTSTLKTSLV